MNALRRLRIAKLTTTRGITNNLLTSSACWIGIWSTLALLNLIRGILINRGAWIFFHLIFPCANIFPKKTEIMVFQKRARLIIDVVQEYTYLGTRMFSSGNFSVSREHLKEKALHALFSFRRHTNLRKLKAALACKIFDTMISLILTYNSEIWGVYAKPDLKTCDGSQIEEAHLQFC